MPAVGRRPAHLVREGIGHDRGGLRHELAEPGRDIRGDRASRPVDALADELLGGTRTRRTARNPADRAVHPLMHPVDNQRAREQRRRCSLPGTDLHVDLRSTWAGQSDGRDQLGRVQTGGQERRDVHGPHPLHAVDHHLGVGRGQEGQQVSPRVGGAQRPTHRARVADLGRADHPRRRRQSR